MTPAGSRGPDRPQSASLSQTIDVETPELVVFSYTIAGVGSRALAALIDAVICLGAILALLFVLAAVSPTRTEQSRGGVFDAWAAAIVGIAIFCVLWGYYVLFEGLADGQTPGKRMLRLRVVRDGGYSITFGASAVRNIVRFVDMQPIALYAVGLFGVIVSKQGKRLGDMVAGTLVVKEDLVQQPKPANAEADAAAPQPAPGLAPALHTLLSDAEYELLEQFIQRQHTLDEEHRNALAARLVERLSA